MGLIRDEQRGRTEGEKRLQINKKESSLRKQDGK